MKFRVVNKKMVCNEIREMGATVVRGYLIQNEIDMVYYGPHFDFGILEKRTSERSFCIDGINLSEYYWRVDDEPLQSTVLLPDVIGYEDDENNKLIYAERYDEISHS